MTDVIKIEGYEEFKDLVRFDNEDIAVSVRELHRLLGIKKDFTDWFKYQCKRLNLVEGMHYVLLNKVLKQEGKGGKNKVDYIVPLDIGELLCIISQRAIARSILQYLIGEGKVWNSPELSLIRDMIRDLELSPDKFIAKVMELFPDAVDTKDLGHSHAKLKAQCEELKALYAKIKAQDAELKAKDAKLEAQKSIVEYHNKVFKRSSPILSVKSLARLKRHHRHAHDECLH